MLCTENKKAMNILKVTCVLALIIFGGWGCAQNQDIAKTTSQNIAQDTYALFSVNVQDFSYPEKSAETVRKIIDIHEKYHVPVDIYLTSTMVDLYEKDHPELLQKIKESSWAAAAYHIRPPYPYHAQAFDGIGLSALPKSEQYQTIMKYETHGIDLATGETTEAPGGYAHLKEIMGYAPYVVGIASDPEIAGVVGSVYKNLGAQFAVAHSDNNIANLGDERYGLLARPEHVDLRLFEHLEEDAKALIDQSFIDAKQKKGGEAPWFVGIKVHDNDFFAEDSAWVTVYLAKGARKGPPYNTSLTSSLISPEQSAELWSLYEQTVAYVADHYQSINAPGLKKLLESK